MNRILSVGLSIGGRSGLRWAIPTFNPAISTCIFNTNSSYYFQTRQIYQSPCLYKSFHFNSFNYLNLQYIRKLSKDAKPPQSGKELSTTTQGRAVVVPKKSLWRRFVDEVKHYWHGTKLLGYEIRISSRLVKKILQGKELNRRERQQLVRTAGDMFRIVPFIALVAIPFAELAIPVLLKLFPNMLPSTFVAKNFKEEKRRKQLKAKLEMAKFLQETLKDSADHASATANGDVPTIQEFYRFLDKERKREELPSIDEIVKYSKLFEDEFTLDRMSHRQLQAMCRVLDLNTVGTNPILRFQLRMKVRELEMDDRSIQKEGVSSLNEEELQSACHSRGMKSFGLPVDRLREQMSEWLDLHLDRKVPISLLLFSRALYLPQVETTEEQLSEAISQLPRGAAEEAKLALQEKLGDRVDALVKLEVLKTEMDEIEKENLEKIQSAADWDDAIRQGKKPVVAEDESVMTDELEEVVDQAPLITAYPPERSKLKDSDPPVEVSVEDVDALQSAIEAIATDRQMNIDAVQIKELRTDMSELLELLNSKKQKPPGATTEVSETKVNRYLLARLNMILDQAEQDALDMDQVSAPDIHHEYIVHINELVATVKRLKHVEDDRRLHKIISILDENNDGWISVNEVLKVIDLLDEENIDVKDRNLREIIELIKKEDRVVEFEGKKPPKP